MRPASRQGIFVTASGPKEPLVVRRKEKRFGIWVNTDSVTVDEAPSFYAVATSGPFDEIISSVKTYVTRSRSVKRSDLSALI